MQLTHYFDSLDKFDQGDLQNLGDDRSEAFGDVKGDVLGDSLGFALGDYPDGIKKNLL